jgi:metallo-beta-lactamase family protein
MKLEFFGAAGEVTGSCHVLHVNGYKVLLDCGLIQGGRKDEERNRDPFPFEASKIDAVVLSHAHLDHCGRLPLLVKRGFRGPVYAQEATCELVDILLADAAHLAERDAEYRSRKTGNNIKPLYTLSEADEVVRQLQGRRYRQKFEVVPGVTVRFKDAGHILGSCAVEVWVEHRGTRRKIVFSGDLGQYDTPILRDPDPINDADVVLMESTYGARRHRERQQTLEELGDIFTSERSRRGNILIPAFSIGRSQEIMYQLGKHYEEWNLRRFQVFLDSPMAIRASRVYWENPQLFDEEATRLRLENGGMPLLPNLTLTSATEDSMAINRIRSGAIVIAGSGMCNGGRIVHHLKHNLDRAETQVLITGYQAYGSLGRRLVNGEETVRIHGQTIPVRAAVHTVGGLSAHGDQDDMARWYENMENRPPVYLVHGEPESQETFASYLSNRCGAQVKAARPGDVLDLVTLEAA